MLMITASVVREISDFRSSSWSISKIIIGLKLSISLVIALSFILRPNDPAAHYQGPCPNIIINLLV